MFIVLDLSVRSFFAFVLPLLYLCAKSWNQSCV